MKLLSVFCGALCALISTVTTDANSAYTSASPSAVIIVNYTDAAGYGFNEAGIGASRKTALEYALGLWAAKLKGTQTIVVNAFCANLGGTATSAVLASAGPLQSANAAWLPYPSTTYPLGLVNQYGEQDFSTGVSDIQVRVNIDVDNATVLGATNFYYGTNASPGSHIDIVTVLLHELAHGFGFLTFMDSTGAMAGGIPDTYMRNLVQGSSSGTPLTSMNDAGRAAAIISNNLYWDGSSLKNRIITGTTRYGNVKMYAPTTYQSGSSVSHFDTSNTPNLLMEPSYTGAAHGMDVTGNVLRDVGWFLDSSALPATLSGFTVE